MAGWRAELVVGRRLARRLIAEQFPELGGERLELLAEGWDNTVWRVGHRWAFRFPRRAIAVAGVEREMALLRRLGPLLPLPIPQPAFLGRPGGGYPWPFFGCALLPGRELADAAPGDALRHRLASSLGRFLRVLHSAEVVERIGAAVGVAPAAPAVETASALPPDPMGRADMRRRVPVTRDRLAAVEALGLWRPPAVVTAWLEEAAALAPAEPSVVAHGDLHLRHVLVDATGAPTGVIDWGDLCLADPAIDLPLLWCALPPGHRPAFLAAYGPVDATALLRSRVLALFLCASLAEYAHREGMPRLERESVAGLQRTVRDG